MSASRVITKRARQRGAVLIIALIFLVALSLIGVSGMRNTNLQERMAGNARGRDLAFQAAESALRVAEATLPKNSVEADAQPETPDGDRCQPNTRTCWQDRLFSDTWKKWVTVPEGEKIGKPVTAQEYFIEHFKLKCKAKSPVECHYYRITAHGEVGGDGGAGANVMLQTMHQLDN